MDLAQLVTAITTKRQIIGKEVLDTPLTIEQVYQARDSLSKHLYGTIFSWIVQKINSSISVNSGPEESKGGKPAAAKKGK